MEAVLTPHLRLPGFSYSCRGKTRSVPWETRSRRGRSKAFVETYLEETYRTPAYPYHSRFGLKCDRSIGAIIDEHLVKKKTYVYSRVVSKLYEYEPHLDVKVGKPSVRRVHRIAGIDRSSSAKCHEDIRQVTGETKR